MKASIAVEERATNVFRKAKGLTVASTAMDNKQALGDDTIMNNYLLFGGDSDDDELDEEPDAPTEFEWQGTTYWLTWHGHVMDEEDGAIVGRWDEESESVVFDE